MNSTDRPNSLPSGCRTYWRALLLLLAFAFVTVGRAGPAASEALGPLAAAPGQVDLIGPAGSEEFGAEVWVLPNGNIVVSDPRWDAPGPIANAGAVYLYDGATLALISALKGGTAQDRVGSGRITILPNGNFVVTSSSWDDPSGPKADAGAVTWCNATTGCNFVISAANSLVGSSIGDSAGNVQGGLQGVTALATGNYVVITGTWDSLPPSVMSNVGAITFCNGTSGCTGPISAANSLVGSTASDNLGSFGVTALTNGNYTVASLEWDSLPPSAKSNVGAVTFCNGLTGCTGPITAANSLLGSSAGDFIGHDGVREVAGGNYVVLSSDWDNSGPTVDAGAVTWCSGSTGCLGTLTSANSLVGGTANDQVGLIVDLLSNGNYLVRTPGWDGPGAIDAGALTFCLGTGGCSGVVSALNSLVGSSADDRVGGQSLEQLANGNFIVLVPGWNNGATQDVGAARLCSGTAGCIGPISPANSLIGSTAGDQVGDGANGLLNGNYTVGSPAWDNPAGPHEDAGAVTFCSGISGCTGLVTAANSLVGGSPFDEVGGVRVLANGNYVVNARRWDNPAPLANDVGAVTWCSGSTGCNGVMTAANSFIGSSAGDQFGSVYSLSNGHYVVTAWRWDNPVSNTVNVGAVTWCDGFAPCVGVVGPANSLIGSTQDDGVGGDLTTLPNGNYVTSTGGWDNAALAAIDVGAVTWCSGTGPCIGLVSTANSLVGSSAGDKVGDYGVFALPSSNYVVLSPDWDSTAPTVLDAGAVTFCGEPPGCIGVVSAANSLVGSSAGDKIGNTNVQLLPGGNYFVPTPGWDSVTPLIVDAEAVTYGNSKTGVFGPVSEANSVIGTITNGINGVVFDAVRMRLIVLRQASLRITVYTPQDGYDVDCARGIDALDALAAMRTIAGFIDPPIAIAPCDADVDGDSVASIADVLAIRRRLVLLE